MCDVGQLLERYDQIILADFEFVIRQGELPDPVCLAWREEPSGQTYRLWRDQLSTEPPYRTDAGTLHIHFVSNAELLNHLTLGWPLPTNVLDLNPEFRCIANGRTVPAGKGLLGALSYYRFSDADSKLKDAMQARIGRGWPFTSEERVEILKYCASDVDAMHRLLPKILPEIDFDIALHRGQFVATLAKMEARGVPIERAIHQQLADKRTWRSVRDAMVPRIDREYGAFTRDAGGEWHFSLELFEQYLDRAGITNWPRTATGKLSTSRRTFEYMSKGNPQLENLRQLRHLRDQMRKIKLAVGADSRNRCTLWPFKSKTGRTQPKAALWIFSPATWLRNLIAPESGQAVAYCDWSSAEFIIAAALSRDPMMLKFYRDRDPYLNFAKRVGAAPATATKATHGGLRDRYKVGLLAIQYGAGAETLAGRLNISAIAAHEMINQHRELFAVYWAWAKDWLAHALNTGVMRTPFNWQCRTGITEFGSRSLMNWPVQSCCTDALRVACIWGDRHGLQLLSPVHDAILLGSSEEKIGHDVTLLQEIMRRAMRIVINPDNDPMIPDVRCDAKIVRHPDHYTDPRGNAMWGTVLELLELHRRNAAARAAATEERRAWL